MKQHRIIAITVSVTLLYAGVSLGAPSKGATERPKHQITLQIPEPAPALPTAAEPIIVPSTSTPTSPTATAAGEAIDWQVLAGGGGDAAGGVYAVSGTLGQAIVGDVGTSPYQVSQGYWQSFSCCTGTTGNVNMTGIVDLSDLSLLVLYLIQIPPPTLPCPDAANVNTVGIIDLSDLSLLVLRLIEIPPPPLPNCP